MSVASVELDPNLFTLFITFFRWLVGSTRHVSFSINGPTQFYTHSILQHKITRRQVSEDSKVIKVNVHWYLRNNQSDLRDQVPHLTNKQWKGSNLVGTEKKI